MKAPRIVGITLGDINGIGPEVALKAVARIRAPAHVRFVFIGDTQVLSAQARALGLPAPAPWNPRVERAPGRRVTVWNPTPSMTLRWTPGRQVPEASAAGAVWIRAAARAALQGQLHAVVTAPISKEGFQRAGIRVPGHTEYLARLTGTRRYAMMLFGGALRVVVVTRHIPLAAVPRALTGRAIFDAIDLTARALRWLGLRRARIAVCGLNPHAGEGGEIGREEITVIRPAVQRARRKGFDAVGPLPADTVFHQAARGDYDAVVAMYHDQGLAPLKLLAFDEGVNLTIGLPIVRTSPDHGTAFDIAGKNRANPSSMGEAMRWAVFLSGRKNPWRQ
jgi:4-hydroxythreonine-4-phosphate dehydrogenase